MSDNNEGLFQPNYVIKIINSVLKFKTYEDRNDVLRVAQAMARTALANEKYSQEVKNAYMQAFEEIQGLTYEEMQEIIKIISVPKPVYREEDDYIDEDEEDSSDDAE